MKNPLEIINSLPKPVVELLSFSGFVLGGSIFKMFRQKEHGVKITLTRFLVEAFMSFFIAMIVYATVDQFLHFNKLFTYALCSTAGSMSSTFYSKMEDLINSLFDGVKEKFNQYLK
ncbi:hypothetical protein AMR72_16290 [Flavobacterium psychrophilum]|nr:hypothetical protein AMR72_16290 [Flavobacterium psychrophilum]AOE53924.1 hypothetical protein ALW18_16280 [Flavobacterium psychrophilum]